MKILFSNLAYGKDISGSLKDHLMRAARHLYTRRPVQMQALGQFRHIMEEERPDLCCLVEIDRGSLHSGYFNQLHALMCEDYCFFDIADKYGEGSRIGRMPLHAGKSNAFLASQDFPFERRHFTHGTKRLIYELQLPGEITLFFAHFSLQKKVRMRQFEEVTELVRECQGEVMILADFNILKGLDELTQFLDASNLKLLNEHNQPTFRFHKRQLVLDLCLCTPSLAERANLRVIPQTFSDHAALVVDF